MRGSRRNRVRPDEAERLLATGRDPTPPELDRLLAAATAPPRPQELTGLEAALTAFEEAGRDERPAQAPAPPRLRMLRPLAAAAAVSVLLVGGVAVAAETGYLPGTDPPPARESLAPRDAPPSSAPAPASPSAASRPATRPPSPSASPSAAAPAVVKLCRTWEDRHRKGKPMKLEELRELAREAGGEDRIPAFCAPLLRPHGKPPVTPGPPTATDHPGKGKGPKNDGGPAG
ncbi:hypothetical protein RB614_12850 [Phytohabitans sp. ZYX-F-186]|uniref:Uncharacterized protein n=1 Tax=Phytohabitans maris TaxID=3071409 RepID=A0ABU0ZEC6_9ACTN|nr:hypothetical protein [Phytohabitans sp. ZYX-F-186]MDQ7905414.1 hypothetical protein [Phytohabitans sp. ZYX-F-186]